MSSGYERYINKVIIIITIIIIILIAGNLKLAAGERVSACEEML